MTQHQEHGLSMIELLVALALSSLLILGAIQIYIDNRSNHLFHQGQSENIENGRYALLILERQLAKAGYRRSPDDSFEFAFPAISSGDCTFEEGQTIRKIDDTTLCLRYQPQDNTERDCSQTSSFSGLDTPYNSFTESIVERITVTDDEILTCNSAELATGVSAIRFDFGVGPAGVREVTGYTATPGSDQHIRSLRYALLMASDRGSRQGMSSKAYTDWHNGSAASDNRLYLTVSNSMTLRNLMP